MQYPISREDATETTLGGHRFPDPYQWMMAEGPEVAAWDEAQNKLTKGYLNEWPHYEAVRNLVDRYTDHLRFASVPDFAGGRWFRKHLLPESDHGRLECAPDIAGPWEALLDVDVTDIVTGLAANSDHPQNIEWFRPSPDGNYVAVGVTLDGSEQNHLYLLDTRTKTVCDYRPTELINDGWSGGASWLPDSSGFYFCALVESSSVTFRNGVYYYDILAQGSTSELQPLDLGTGISSYVCPQIGADGRFVVATAGLFEPTPSYVRDLTTDSDWRPFVDDVSGVVAGRVVGDQYVAMTDVGANRGRIVRIDLNSETPNEPDSWVEVLPESDATKRALWAVGGLLYVLEFVNTFAQVQIVDLNGQQHGLVPLPPKAVVANQPYPFMDLPDSGHPEKFVFQFSTLTSSTQFGQFAGPGNDVKVLTQPEITLDGATIISKLATSSDGTQIPYHIVTPAHDAGGPLPTLLYGYGGLNAPFWPRYPIYGMAAFVAAGGIFVHTHLRGGAEFGRDWWTGARFGNRQRTFDDLYAIAEDLITSGRTTTELLVLHGQSGGGTLAGVAATQRPDLWSAVSPGKPFLDMIGACGTPYGRSVIDGEWADLMDDDSIESLAAHSPCELARNPAAYPAVFVDVGATDTRCPPWHGRKFAAALQSSSTSEAPVLVRVRENVGHGISNGRQESIEQTTDWLSFLMRSAGLVPESPMVGSQGDARRDEE